MTYSTILVHLDDGPRCAARVDAAARIARAQDAHLVGLAATGPVDMPPQARAAMGDALWRGFLDELDRGARQVADAFEGQVADLGLRSFEKRVARGRADDALLLHGRYADLIVVGKPDGAERQGVLAHDALVHLLRESGRPVLVVPASGPVERIGGRALVAWAATRESMRAVSDALPLLRAAAHVDVLVFNARPGVVGHGELAGADLALYLARHGVQVEVHDEVTGIDVGNALLSRAADFGSDLVVMGAYGHSALRERLFGGVSETVLRSLPVPVFMSH